MFLDRYPYTDNQQLNLDWILKKIIELSKALNISYDNTSSGLTATNVQEALDELNDLIGQIAQTASAFTLIDNSIAESAYVLGQSFNHLQTINTPTLMEIIMAMRDDKYIDLRRYQTILGNDIVDNFIMTNVEYNPGIFCHKLTLKDVYGYRITTIKIYGLNDDQNVYVEIEPDVTITHVNSFNSRVGDVLPAAHDYDADQVDYDNTGSGLTATEVQAAIDEVNAKAGVTSFHSRTGAVQPAAHDYDADQVDYDNTVSGLTATDVQGAIDEVAGALPDTVVNSFNSRTGAVSPAASDYDADQIDYDNSVSGITATDVQAAIDEIVNLVLSSGVASFNSRTGAVLPAAHDYDADQVDYDNQSSGLVATDVQAAIDELNTNITGIAKYTGNHTVSVPHDGVKTASQVLDELKVALATYVNSKPANYRYQIINCNPYTSSTSAKGYNDEPGMLYLGSYVRSDLNFIAASNRYFASVNIHTSGSTSILYDMTTNAYIDQSTQVQSTGVAQILLAEYEIV